jgi:hypothetical protein
MIRINLSASAAPVLWTILVAVTASIVSTSANSQEAAAEAEVISRRVVFPPSGGGPRITVQIDPVEQARILALAPRPPKIVPRAQDDGAAGEPGQAPASNYAWFWERVSPALSEGTGRWLAAMSALDAPPDGTPQRTPRLQTLQDIAQAHGADILRASVGTTVSPALALAVIAVESAGRSQAVSSAGAQGLMQLIPATAERFGVIDAFDTSQNIKGGVTYLNWLLDHFDQDVVLALAGYNAGEGAVRRNGGVPPFAETRDYVPKVLAAWRVARGLCATPPELPSDGCVFKIGQSG